MNEGVLEMINKNLQAININKNLQMKLIRESDRKTQLLICMEEPAELIQAISKIQRLYQYPIGIDIRNANEAINNLHEEIADVYICLLKLQILFGIDDSEIQQWINYKEEREFRRLIKNEKKL